MTISADSNVSVGWHDSHCSSVCGLDAQGHILFAAAEERFNKKKMCKDFPAQALAELHARLNCAGAPLAYPDLAPTQKAWRNTGLLWNSYRNSLNTSKSIRSLLATAGNRMAQGQYDGVSGSTPGEDTQRHYDFLCDHHEAHAASAYYASGFGSTWVVTVDGVGDCLSGTIYQGVAGVLERRRHFYYNELTVGADYESLTALLGFNPDRHCGKITGLAAYGTHNDKCILALSEFFAQSWRRGRHNWFDRMHGPRADEALRELRAHRESTFKAFSREDLAYAIQYLSEQRILEIVRDNIPNICGNNIAVAGGVFANVRINQKIKELGFKNIFVQPAMDDSGLAIGAAYCQLAARRPLEPHRLPHMFVGPSFGEDAMADALDRAGMHFERETELAFNIARLLNEGKVVARFDGAMEFGPRALGNRSILYATQDVSVNNWLNKRLKRTEFMPFAPATLAEHAESCYEGLEGCTHTAEFMTITFNCTPQMKRMSPAVVHVDGTARCQIVRQQVNPGMHAILEEYHRLTGVPSLVNTSFNMHESPIVCTPEDAIKAFQHSELDYLAMGPFLVPRQDASIGKTLVSATTPVS